MSKKVAWKQPDVNRGRAQLGQYGSFKEFLAKSESIRLEQERANKSLQKAMGPMLELLKLRLQKGAPLIVMRPLQYRTSEIPGQGEMDDIEKSFYNRGSDSSESEQGASFVDVVKTILPGTQLVLKSLSQSIREFYFVDPTGKEYEISFDDRNQLLTQTDIYETALKYLDTQGDK